jgi:hypothetical protein
MQAIVIIKEAIADVERRIGRLGEGRYVGLNVGSGRQGAE